MDNLEEKYYSDPSFRTLVDMLIHLMYTNKYKPSEIVDASEMAYLKYQNREDFINKFKK